MQQSTKYNPLKDAILEDIVNSLVRIADPDTIILFGSQATGRVNKDSDYGFCVLKRNVNRKKMLDKIYRTGLNADVPVDIIIDTPKKFNELKQQWFMVYYDVAKYGKVVYEKGKYGNVINKGKRHPELVEGV